MSEKLTGRQTVEVSVQVSASLEIEAGTMHEVLLQARDLGDMLVSHFSVQGEVMLEDVASDPVAGVTVHDDVFVIDVGDESERYWITWEEAKSSHVVSVDTWTREELLEDIREGESS